MSSISTIVWFRQDLRIEDNPAFAAAVQHGDVIPLYIWNPETEGKWPLGGASRWWLHHSLERLSENLAEQGLRLILRKGNPCEIIKDVIAESGAQNVFWNRRYEPYAIEHDTQLKKALNQSGIETKSFNANLLFEPWTIANKQGKPFQVFTPFWKTCLAHSEPAKPFVTGKPKPFISNVKSESLAAINLLPKIGWDKGLQKTWIPGTKGAKKALSEFLDGSILAYKENRDRPDVKGISLISPHLHFGEISPRTIWHNVINRYSKDEAGVECFLRQLGWREFGHHLLFHFPFTPNKPLRKDFETFEWIHDPSGLKAWQKGLTGYPFIDAGMRQLWQTGWMHNRVRMVVGSFLVKDLRISWVKGAEWFWDTLVDADLANNTLGWQWVGGCGADAAPYFRVFNPITQGEKFDPDGKYVREWVPELAKLPNCWIHRPWEAPAELLNRLGISLGNTYPWPIVDHAEAREKALAAFAAMRQS